MSIWITILMSVLPAVLKWVIDLIASGKRLSISDAKKLNNALWYMDRLNMYAPKIGCMMGGVTPANAADFAIKQLPKPKKKGK